MSQIFTLKPGQQLIVQAIKTTPTGNTKTSEEIDMGNGGVVTAFIYLDPNGYPIGNATVVATCDDKFGTQSQVEYKSELLLVCGSNGFETFDFSNA